MTGLVKRYVMPLAGAAVVMAVVWALSAAWLSDETEERSAFWTTFVSSPVPHLAVFVLAFAGLLRTVDD